MTSILANTESTKSTFPFYMDDRTLHVRNKEIQVNKKRNFFNMINRIMDALELAYNSLGDSFVDWYIELVEIAEKPEYIVSKTDKLSSKDELKIQSFCEEYANKACSYTELNELISDHIEKIYSVNLDEVTKTAKACNEELQFLDIHAKALLKSSLLDLIVVTPIILYGASHKKIKYETIINYVFSESLRIEPRFNLINKLTKVIESRVRMTIYPHKVIWEYLKNLAIDENIVTQNLRRSLICDIIPKLDPKQSVVSLITAVIGRQIDFQFSKKFNIQYKPVTIDYRDNEETSTLDQIENLSQRDEGLKVMYEYDVKRSIVRLEQQMGIEVSRDMLVYYNSAIIINDFQKNVVFQVLTKITQIPYEYFHCLNKVEYLRALNVVITFLKKSKFNNLSRLIVSNIIPKKFLKKPSFNSKNVAAILGNYSFEVLHEKNFGFISDRLRSNEFLLNKCLELNSYSILKIPTYQEWKDEYSDVTLTDVVKQRRLVESVISGNTALNETNLELKKANTKGCQQDLFKLYKFIGS